MCPLAKRGAAAVRSDGTDATETEGTGDLGYRGLSAIEDQAYWPC